MNVIAARQLYSSPNLGEHWDRKIPLAATAVLFGVGRVYSHEFRVHDGHSDKVAETLDRPGRPGSVPFDSFHPADRNRKGDV
jgi:hypothetical protein